MRRLGFAATALAVVVLGAGCARIRLPEPELLIPEPPKEDKDYYRQLGPGMPALRKITDPARLPDFRKAFPYEREGLLRSLDLSINYFGYPSSRKYYPVQDITHDRALESLKAFRDLIVSVQTPNELHERIIAKFDVYESVGCDDEGTVLFTGYYTPIFDASLTRTSEFRWPLHKLPPDLKKDAEGACLGRELPDGSRVPYYTRREIAGGALKGRELVYLRSRFDAYVCTVQGSAQLRLPDGTLFKIGYHGNNGKEYTSVGLALVKAGLLSKKELSLLGLTRFFNTHPEKMDEYLFRNERYVFFQRSESEPTGSLGMPVTPYRSIATDKSLFPRGCLAMVATSVPRLDATGALVQTRFDQFVLDQDTGGAIHAAGRSDIYIGIGAKAGKIAGWTLGEGRLYYLFLKE